MVEKIKDEVVQNKVTTSEFLILIVFLGIFLGFRRWFLLSEILKKSFYV